MTRSRGFVPDEPRHQHRWFEWSVPTWVREPELLNGAPSGALVERIVQDRVCAECHRPQRRRHPIRGPIPREGAVR